MGLRPWRSRRDLTRHHPRHRPRPRRPCCRLSTVILSIFLYSKVCTTPVRSLYLCPPQRHRHSHKSGKSRARVMRHCSGHARLPARVSASPRAILSAGGVGCRPPTTPISWWWHPPCRMQTTQHLLAPTRHTIQTRKHPEHQYDESIGWTVGRARQEPRALIEWAPLFKRGRGKLVGGDR